MSGASSAVRSISGEGPGGGIVGFGEARKGRVLVEAGGSGGCETGPPPGITIPGYAPAGTCTTPGIVDVVDPPRGGVDGLDGERGNGLIAPGTPDVGCVGVTDWGGSGTLLSFAGVVGSSSKDTSSASSSKRPSAGDGWGGAGRGPFGEP
jgi:hypothetical protein